MASSQCILILGGTFDPVHNGHIGLATHFSSLFNKAELRLLPAGNPWQKPIIKASADHRIAMLKCAFDAINLPYSIDTRELDREGATYTIDTLEAIRKEVGNEASLIFIIGADQLIQLNTWHNWRDLFNLTNIATAARPGFSNSLSMIPKIVADEYSSRAASAEQLMATPAGLTYLARDLDINISSTDIRTALRNGQDPIAFVPEQVLDYIKKNNLYKE